MLRTEILQILDHQDTSIEDKMFALFEYQYSTNTIYQQFIHLTRYNGFKPRNASEIPYLPIILYKSNVIKSGTWTEEKIFYSSGTTASHRSRHMIRSVDDYLSNAKSIWETQFGDISSFEFISLLPSYHDNPSSSLLAMVEEFMIHGTAGKRQYFLNSTEELFKKIENQKSSKKPLVLFGVSFALLEYVESYQHEDVSFLIVIETGGMKKYRKEITRAVLHDRLQFGFSGAIIRSEYGMTECLSQMYSNEKKLFVQNDRMRIQIMDATDPLVVLPYGHKGRIAICDLANIDTCAFIATDDLGKINDDGEIEIIGRLDSTDLRGCNYLI